MPVIPTIFACMAITISLIHTTYAESNDGIEMPVDHDERFQNAKPAGMSFPDESDKVYQSEAKRLDDYQLRLQEIEHQLKIRADEEDRENDEEINRLYNHEKRLKDIELELTRITSSSESAKNYDEQIKRLDDYQRRLQKVELHMETRADEEDKGEKCNEQIKRLDDFENRVSYIKMLSNNVSKKLDDHEVSLQKIEQVLKRHSGNMSKVADIQDIKILSKTEFKDQPKAVSDIKPVEAFQISTFKNDYYKHDFEAKVALDGNETTWMHTERHTNPWWCADMGDIYHVTRVVVKNRKIGPRTHFSVPTRAWNLRVGITNTRPLVAENLTLDAYMLCGEKPGLMGESANVTCPDGVFGQYVVVQFNTTSFMHITEVKIYGYIDQPGMLRKMWKHIHKTAQEGKVHQDIKFETKGKDKSPEISHIQPIEAFQISNFPAEPRATAHVAIDGDEEHWMHTERHTNPWWCADMGDIYHVTRVVVKNRKVGPRTAVWTSERAENLRVGVTNTRPVVGESLDLDSYVLCDEKPGVIGESANVTCPHDVLGQYVVVQLNTTNFMHITEVEIYGYIDQPGMLRQMWKLMHKTEQEQKASQDIKFKPKTKSKSPEVSHIQPIEAFQISTYEDDENNDAKVAIDGKENTVTNTDKHTNPWWCADMGGIYHVTNVVVINRKVGKIDVINRAMNLRVGVTNTKPVVGKTLELDAYTLCGEKPGLMGKDEIINCADGVSGKYLVVQFKTKDFMNIDEVKIYGYTD